MHELTYDGSFDNIGASNSVFPKLSVSFKSTELGLQLELSAVATEPFEFTVVAEGYERKTIVLGPNAGPEFRAPLKPRPAAAEEP